MADDETQPEAVEEAAPQTDGEIIASRGADIDAETSDTFDKVFVVAVVGGVKPTASGGYDHEPNKAATREFAIQAGLRPTGEVKIKSTTVNAAGDTAYDITYSVPVKLASDQEPEDAPITVLDQDDDSDGSQDAGKADDSANPTA